MAVMEDSVSLSATELVERCFYLQEDLPFSFSDRDYLLPVYNGMYKEIILCFGRQCEKSTFICNRILMEMISRPFFKCMFVTPEKKHAEEFERDKLSMRLAYSPIMYKTFFPRRGGGDVVINNVFEKRLTNGSRLIFRSSFRDPLSCRGPSMDLVAIDEIQDMNPDFIPIILETLAHSEHKIKLYAGTPKTRDDALDRYWSRSTQTEWMFKCPRGHYNRQDLEIIHNDGPRCIKCGEMINRLEGEWVTGNRNADMAGFRISQLQAPWLSWQEIINKQIDYGHDQFMNEVLAIATEIGDHPLALDDVVACCDPKLVFANSRVSGLGPTFAGVDWSGGSRSFTVLTIVTIYHDRFIVLFAKKFSGMESDPEIQVNEIARICKSFGVSLIMADSGCGWMPNSQLRKAYSSERVLEIMYTTSLSRLFTWNKKTSKYSGHRETLMSRLFNGIKRQQFKFPRWELFRPFAQDLLNVTSEYNEQSRSVRYGHPQDRPDDFCHSLVYAMLAAEVGTGTLVVDY